LFVAAQTGFVDGPRVLATMATDLANPLILRQFIGNAEMGWKMAWSDRMISAYGGVWLAGLLYAALGKRAPRLSPKAWLLIGIAPIFADGITHMLNDILAGTAAFLGVPPLEHFVVVALLVTVVSAPMLRGTAQIACRLAYRGCLVKATALTAEYGRCGERRAGLCRLYSAPPSASFCAAEGPQR